MTTQAPIQNHVQPTFPATYAMSNSPPPPLPTTGMPAIASTTALVQGMPGIPPPPPLPIAGMPVAVAGQPGVQPPPPLPGMPVAVQGMPGVPPPPPPPIAGTAGSSYIPPAFPAYTPPVASGSMPTPGMPIPTQAGMPVPGMPAFPAPTQAISSVPAPPLPPGWTEHLTPDGVPYYYHALSRLSTYTRPENPHAPPQKPKVLKKKSTKSAKSAKSAAAEKPEKPVKKERVPGSDWYRVKTSRGNVFYRHRERGSVWECPEEILEAVREMERKEEEEAAAAAAAAAARAKEEAERQESDEEGEREGEEEGEGGKKRPAEDEAGPSKKKRPKVVIEDSRSRTGSQPPAGDEAEAEEEVEDEEQDPSALEAEARAAAARWASEAQAEASLKAAQAAAAKEAKARAEAEAAALASIPIEEARAGFRKLLEENKVDPLAPFESATRLLEADKRYKALASEREREEVFNAYCRDTLKARAATPAPPKPRLTAEEEYMKLLREDVTSTRTSWTEWRRKWKKDRRFWGWGSERDREGRFRSYLKELGEKKRKEKEDAEREFREMLLQAAERGELEVGGEEGKEKEWSEVKGMFRKDRRYDAVGSSSAREELYAAFVKDMRGKKGAAAPPSAPAAMRTVGPPPTSSAAPAAAPAAPAASPAQPDKPEKHESKLERQQRALRERESQVKQTLARAERQAEASRTLLGAEEGEREFGSLLVDAVRDLDLSWTDVLPSLRADPRFARSTLTGARQRQMYDEHLASLRRKHLHALEGLFEAHSPALNTPFSSLPASVGSSLPATKLGLSAKELEREYDRWSRERQERARREFDEMLKENSFVLFWGRARKLAQRAASFAEGGGGVAPGVLEETAQYGDEEEFISEEADGAGGGLGKRAAEVGIKELEKVLSGDRRWRLWDWKADEREKWLEEWLERLEAPGKSVHTGEI